MKNNKKNNEYEDLTFFSQVLLFVIVFAVLILFVFMIAQSINNKWNSATSNHTNYQKDIPYNYVKEEKEEEEEEKDIVATSKSEMKKSLKDYFQSLDYNGFLYDFNKDGVPELVYTNGNIVNNVLYSSKNSIYGFEVLDIPFSDNIKRISKPINGVVLFTAEKGDKNNKVIANTIIDTKDNYKTVKSLQAEKSKEYGERYFIDDTLTTKEEYDKAYSSIEKYQDNLLDEKVLKREDTIDKMFKYYNNVTANTKSY